MYSASGEIVREILGWQPKGFTWGTCLVFPFRDAAGALNGYARIRPDFPRKRDDGDVIKYESPRGKGNRAYFPPGIRDILNDASKPLILTEGEKKSLAAMQRGFACIGLVGVWGWQEKRRKTDAGQSFGPRKLMSDLDAIAWKGRLVFIAFDSDVAQNQLLRLAQQRLAECLIGLGADVRLVQIPGGAKDEKQGLDDFLARHGDAGATELQKLLDAAEPAKASAPPTPLDWARLLVEDQFTEPSGRSLVWWRDEFYLWRGTHYTVISDTEFFSLVLGWLGQRNCNPRRSLVGDVMACLKTLARVPFEFDVPFLAE